MLLQPLIENAYLHGLSRIRADGLLVVSAKRQSSVLEICVRNSGVGLRPKDPQRTGVGLANVRDRLRLHYGDDQTCRIEEFDDGAVQVTIVLPLEFCERPTGTLAGYGVS
jgi:LytS/YehU family sensor histidine kinase